MSFAAPFTALGTPAALRAAQEPLATQPTPTVFNDHIHVPPNFSAFSSLGQAVEQAKTEGCVALGISNYYDFSVYTDFSARAKNSGIVPLFGLEIMCRDQALADANVKANDPGNPGKVYLCGKGIMHATPQTDAGRTTLDTVRRNDRTRMANMLNRCVATLAERGCTITITAEAITADIATRYDVPIDTVFLQERHLALALQQAVFAAIPSADRLPRLAQLLGVAPKLRHADDASGFQHELRNHLMKSGKPGFVAETYISLTDARQLIAALGGFTCYPVVGDGMNPLSAFEADPTTLANNLTGLGIVAADFVPPRNRVTSLTAYVTTLRQRGIIVTAGTEHNTPDLIPIAPTCAQGEPIPEDVQRIFWEGTCVIAAHQFLVAHGEPGFTDHPVNEARIAAFAALGAEVMRRWRRK